MMALHGGQRLLDAGKPEAQFYSGLANAFIFDIGLLSCGTRVSCGLGSVCFATQPKLADKPILYRTAISTLGGCPRYLPHGANSYPWFLDDHCWVDLSSHPALGQTPLTSLGTLLLLLSDNLILLQW